MHTVFLSGVLAAVSLGIAAATWVLAVQVVPAAAQPTAHKRVRAWCLRGFLLPWAAWCVMNAGVFPWLPPYMPSVSIAKFKGGAFASELFYVTGVGGILIASYWGAVTLTWILVERAQTLTPEDREKFYGLCITCFAALILISAILLLAGGLPLAGFSLLLIVGCIAAYVPGTLAGSPRQPSYARAVANIKRGKYAAAEEAVLKELEKCDNDFQGWLMLATLYAEHFNDLKEAEQTVLELCDQPTINGSQAAQALNRLADWHLQIGRDPVAARRAISGICARYAGTNAARFANIRLQQMPRSRRDLELKQAAEPVAMPALGDRLDDNWSTPVPRDEAIATANALSEHLHADPGNIEARERFARILAEHLGKAAEAIRQLESLCEISTHPPHKQALWLSWIAAYKLKYLHDEPGALSVLHNIVARYPNTVHAMTARRRIELLARKDHVPAEGCK